MHLEQDWLQLFQHFFGNLSINVRNRTKNWELFFCWICSVKSILRVDFFLFFSWPCIQSRNRRFGKRSDDRNMGCVFTNLLYTSKSILRYGSQTWFVETFFLLFIFFWNTLSSFFLLFISRQINLVLNQKMQTYKITNWTKRKFIKRIQVGNSTTSLLVVRSHRSDRCVLRILFHFCGCSNSRMEGRLYWNSPTLQWHFFNHFTISGVYFKSYNQYNHFFNQRKQKSTLICLYFTSVLFCIAWGVITRRFWNFKNTLPFFYLCSNFQDKRFRDCQPICWLLLQTRNIGQNLRNYL